jgi:hypothetical protein
MLDPDLKANIDQIFAPLLAMQLTQTASPYDELMAQIEPELVSANVPGLRERYAGETPQQAQARADRYAKAFTEYDKRFAGQVSDWSGKAQGVRRQALASTERSDRAREDNQLKSLDDAFRQAA